MGFTMKLLLAYIILSVGAGIAFQQKHNAIGIGLLLAIGISVLILGYLWMYSPM